MFTNKNIIPQMSLRKYINQCVMTLCYVAILFVYCFVFTIQITYMLTNEKQFVYTSLILVSIITTKQILLHIIFLMEYYERIFLIHTDYKNESLLNVYFQMLTPKFWKKVNTKNNRKQYITLSMYACVFVIFDILCIYFLDIIRYYECCILIVLLMLYIDTIALYSNTKMYFSIVGKYKILYRDIGEIFNVLKFICYYFGCVACIETCICMLIYILSTVYIVEIFAVVVCIVNNIDNIKNIFMYTYDYNLNKISNKLKTIMYTLISYVNEVYILVLTTYCHNNVVKTCLLGLCFITMFQKTNKIITNIKLYYREKKNNDNYV